jgi:hypothetical protein
MFLIRAATLLTSLPFFWIGQLLGLFKLPGCMPLLKAAWWISRNDRMGLLALRRIHQRESVASARRQAAEWLASDPRPGMACFAGLLALEAGDWDAAARLRDLCRELGGDSEGLIDWLDLRLMGLSNDDGATEETYRRLAARRDLSPLVSKVVLNYYLFLALVTKKWDEVERRAKHLWSIEESPMAATALWALNRHRGKPDNFHNYIKNLRLDPVQVYYHQGLGYSALEDWEQALQMVAALREGDAQLAASLQNTLILMGASL